MGMNILISACLLGIDCKYNGENNKVQALVEALDNVRFIPVCPEQLGGLTTPRMPAEIVYKDGKRRVVNKELSDVTKEFEKGAEETLKLAKLYHCKAAILKERSPSCGGRQVYDGSFQGKVKQGIGLAAELLMENGIKVYNEENYEDLLKK